LSLRLTFLVAAGKRRFIVTESQPYVNRRVLKINVGFLLAQSAGYQRDIELDFPRIRLDDDLELDYLAGTLNFSRNAQGIWVHGQIEASVVGECARCLSTTSVPVTFSVEELFAFPPTPEVDYFVEETGILDLAPLLREEAFLAMPMGVLCRPDCAGLCPECGQNWNEGPCDCEPHPIDPRFEILRSQWDEGDENNPT
jgi:uncharacterized protein